MLPPRSSRTPDLARAALGLLSALWLVGLESCDAGSLGPESGSPSLEPPRLENPGELDPRVVERVADARQAVVRRPGDAGAWAVLGMVFENERMRGRAADCYGEAARLDPDEPRYWFHRAGALNKIGRNSEAVEAIERSLTLRGDYAPSHARLGNYLFEDGLLEEARAAYERAIGVDTSYPGGWVGLARVHLQLDETAPAIEILEKQLDERPSDVLVKRVLAGAYRQAGRTDEIELPDGERPETSRWPDPWAEELRRHQDDPALRKVTKLLMDGKRDEALAVLEDLRDRAQTPDDELAYLSQLAGLYADLGRLKDAEATYRRLLEIQPENSQVYSHLAEVYERANQLPSAVGTIRTAIRMNPDHAPNYRLAGRIYYKATLYAEAAQAFERVLAYDENSTGILYLYGMSRFGEKKWKEAEDCFVRLLEAEPDHADGWFAFARTNLKLKRLDEAERALEEARARGFDNAQMMSQVTGSLQRARERAARREGKRGG